MLIDVKEIISPLSPGSAGDAGKMWLFFLKFGEVLVK